MNTEDKLKEAALRYHREPQPGKIAVVPTKPHRTQEDLSLAYSPGVAAPSRAVAEDPASVYEYTGKGNLVAVISNGTAVLGLGNIGPLAAKPVMEGKSMLFKTFAGIDAFDIEVAENDPEAFVRTVRAIAPTFGGMRSSPRRPCSTGRRSPARSFRLCASSSTEPAPRPSPARGSSSNWEFAASTWCCATAAGSSPLTARISIP